MAPARDLNESDERVRRLEVRLDALRPELASLAQLVASFDDVVGALRERAASKADLEGAVASLKLGLRAVLEECRARVSGEVDALREELLSARHTAPPLPLPLPPPSAGTDELRAELAEVRRESAAKFNLLAQQRALDDRRIAALEAVVAAHEAQLGEQEGVWLGAMMDGSLAPRDARTSRGDVDDR
ncbi:hypothetical protein KFE25_007744 [Diacronema lutheri]|uniref:Uncharacterized protein n=1 Tax=Diacronema lutheri TaxID=2081491 RepID=A0A8J5XHU5_DIALT|nr:hypothetical protein KFE25_007744 [Diacronema lutheri]